MDLSNLTVLLFPIGFSALHCGIKLNQAHSNFLTKLTMSSLFSIVAVILSYMKVMELFDEQLCFTSDIKMGGYEVMTSFIVFIALLALVNFTIVDQISNKIVNGILSAIILTLVLIPAYFIIFWEYYLIF